VATVPLDRDRVADMKDLEDYVDLMALTLAGRATEEVSTANTVDQMRRKEAR
jgi:hypothetical protein